MKFVLKKSEMENPEAKVRLFLVKDKDGNGTVDLMAQKEGCSSFYILSFKSDGTINRPECVSEDIGFELDENYFNISIERINNFTTK